MSDEEVKLQIKSKDELNVLYHALGNSSVFFKDNVRKDTRIRQELIDRVEKLYTLFFDLKRGGDIFDNKNK